MFQDKIARVAKLHERNKKTVLSSKGTLQSTSATSNPDISNPYKKFDVKHWPDGWAQI